MLNVINMHTKLFKLNLQGKSGRAQTAVIMLGLAGTTLAWGASPKSRNSIHISATVEYAQTSPAQQGSVRHLPPLETVTTASTATPYQSVIMAVITSAPVVNTQTSQAQLNPIIIDPEHFTITNEDEEHKAIELLSEKKKKKIRKTKSESLLRKQRQFVLQHDCDTHHETSRHSADEIIHFSEPLTPRRPSFFNTLQMIKRRTLSDQSATSTPRMTVNSGKSSVAATPRTIIHSSVEHSEDSSDQLEAEEVVLHLPNHLQQRINNIK